VTQLPPPLVAPELDLHTEIILGGNDFTIRHVQDVEPYLDHNKRQYTDGTNGYSPSRELKKTASIPPGVYMKWLIEEGIDALKPEHWDAVKRKLNSSEYLYLRTAGGHIG
jgi:hypothetical protein